MMAKLINILTISKFLKTIDQLKITKKNSLANSLSTTLNNYNQSTTKNICTANKLGKNCCIDRPLYRL